MSEEWVQASEELLERIKRFSVNKDKDRLDLVQSMMFSLYVLHRSLLGWLNWVNNTDTMASFSKEELDEMNKKLAEFAESFIKYDVEATLKGAQKNLGAKKPTQEQPERRSLEEIFYV